MNVALQLVGLRKLENDYNCKGWGKVKRVLN